MISDRITLRDVDDETFVRVICIASLFLQLLLYLLNPSTLSHFPVLHWTLADFTSSEV